MKAILLAAHVLAGIVLVGPITVAASIFPRYARAALTPGGDAAIVGAAAASAAAMHRITRGYALPAVAVPALGLATAAALGVLGQTWVIVSIIPTVVAGLILALAVVPAQRGALDAIRAHEVGALGNVRRLGMTTGLFALTWTVVVVLMVLRPGSTTGV